MPKIAEFEWSSATKYMAWVEQYLNLSQINTHAVYSIKWDTHNTLGKLKAKKKKLLAQVDENMRLVSVYAASLSGEDKEVFETERVFLRTLWVQNRDLRTILLDHLQRIDEIEKGLDTPF